MNFKSFYLKESEEKAIIKDDRLYVNVDALTKDELKKIEGMLRSADYDIRGIEDLKQLITKNKFVEGSSDKKYHIIHTGEWERIIKTVLKMIGKEKPRTDLLPEVIKNIKKQGDITIGRFVNSTTGYILPDGTVINLGGGSKRNNDHRIIGSFFEGEFKNPYEKMEYFLKQTGSIRYIPELPGLEIHRKPTNLQIVQIKNVLTKAHDSLSVDFRSPEYAPKAKTYSKDANPKILERDVLNYYSSGTIRDNSFLEE